MDNEENCTDGNEKEEQHQLEGQIIEGQIVDGQLVTTDGQIEGQIEEIVTPNELGNDHHMINSMYILTNLKE